MSETSLLAILLIAGLCHALWNAVVKFEGSRLFILAMIDGFAMLCGACLLVFVPLPNSEVWIFIVISLILNIFYRIFLLKAYHLGEFSQVYPLVRGIPPLAVTVIAFLFLEEKINSDNLVGITLISLGIICLIFQKQHIQKQTVIYSFISGICIAIYTLVDRMGIRATSNILSYIIWFTFLENLAFPLYATVKSPTHFGSFICSNWRKGLLGGIFAAAGYGIILWAMTKVNLGSVSALRESSILFATLIGLIIYKETHGLMKLISSTFIVIGIFFIHQSL